MQTRVVLPRPLCLPARPRALLSRELLSARRLRHRLLQSPQRLCLRCLARKRLSGCRGLSLFALRCLRLLSDGGGTSSATVEGCSGEAPRARRPPPPPGASPPPPPYYNPVLGLGQQRLPRPAESPRTHIPQIVHRPGGPRGGRLPSFVSGICACEGARCPSRAHLRREWRALRCPWGEVPVSAGIAPGAALMCMCYMCTWPLLPVSGAAAARLEPPAGRAGAATAE